ncbi:MAG: hypothetical protein GC190_10395 [Alphaproteobacteria bacterium]|nr:hypothetical protein [Alphaproteobacteria bacterium]
MHLSRTRQNLVTLLNIVPRFLLSFSIAVVVGGLIAALVAPVQVHADSYEGLDSYNLNRKEEAIHLLRRAAWQDNDLFAQLKLGDIYYAKSDRDKGFEDPVESAVWYYIALLNVNVAEHAYLTPVMDKLRAMFGEASTRFQEIYSSLLQDERIDLRNRITYIEACRGPDGFMLLGQLHDPRITRTSIPLQTTPPQTSPGEDYWSAAGPQGGSYYGGGGSQYYGGTQSFGSLYGDQPLEKNDLEAKLFYTLADDDGHGHPLAKLYLENLGTYASGPQGPGETKAGDKAVRWLSPFEFYADTTRIRGELPSGLVLSDECPINNARARALALGKERIPASVLFEMLQFLDYGRGYSFREMPLAVRKFQYFLREPQTGDLTPLQLVRLIQIAAVRGHKKAQRCLGIMYVHGVGVVKDLVRAEKWLLAADAQGDGEASYALSELYALGGRGIEKSEDKATRFRQNSAVAGFAPVRSEFLRLLDNPPPPSDGPRRHHRRHRNSDDSDD